MKIAKTQKSSNSLIERLTNIERELKEKPIKFPSRKEKEKRLTLKENALELKKSEEI